MRITLIVAALTGMATAGTADTAYACHGQDGEWELEDAYFVPDADAAANGTNYATISVAQGSDTIASFTTASTGLTEGTARALTMSTSTVAARRFGPTDVVKCDKAVAAAGVAIAGRWVLAFRKVQGDTMNTIPTT